MEKRLDIIVFGATGFTGKHVLPYLHKLSSKHGKVLTWGIAGRSEQKLKQVLVEASKIIGVESLSSIPIIIADVSNEDSILEMTKKANVIINCCGPFELYGEVVVKSCVKTGTNYVDVTGESYFQENMEVKYHDSAKQKGVYIVSSCGFDSYNSELPLLFLENKFEGTINSVEFFLNPYVLGDSTGPSTNYGTWESVVNGLGEFRALHALRKSRNLKPVPKIKPTYCRRLPFTKDSSIGIPEKRLIPIPVPDVDVIKRSQRYFYENQGKRPYHVQHYYLANSWMSILLAMCLGFLVILLAQFEFGKNLLLKYPRFFSGGMFDHGVPDEKVIENFKVDTYFYAKGWKNSGTQDYDKLSPNKCVLGRLHISNPAYGFTCLGVTLSAIMILTESSKLPSEGGVYTPAVAFSKTSFVEQFQKNDVPLEILSTKEL